MKVTQPPLYISDSFDLSLSIQQHAGKGLSIQQHAGISSADKEEVLLFVLYVSSIRTITKINQLSLNPGLRKKLKSSKTSAKDEWKRKKYAINVQSMCVILAPVSYPCSFIWWALSFSFLEEGGGFLIVSVESSSSCCPSSWWASSLSWQSSISHQLSVRNTTSSQNSDTFPEMLLEPTTIWSG